MKMASEQEAIEYLNCKVRGSNIIYYDDATSRWYVGPKSDLKYFRQLIVAQDEGAILDAYSVWCTGTSHGEGFDTLEEAEADALKRHKPVKRPRLERFM